MKRFVIGLGLAALGTANSVLASDAEPCDTNMICASSPKTLVKALQNEGYKAKLEKDTDGDPKITSSANGYSFSIYFYGCEKSTKCDSVQFNAGFKPEDDNTASYANAWNTKKRFMQASVNDQKELELRYDVTTAGGLNKRNFADVVDWWATMLSEFSTFVDEQKTKN
jgi:Putative bacterial sensory transduction regulator